MKLYALLVISLLSNNVREGVAIEKFQAEESWCFQMRKQYAVEPGKSFGNLPQHIHDKYLEARCYRFFCKPHPRAGKGVFECDPLPGDIAKLEMVKV